MPCYKPIEAWRAKYKNPSGKTPLVFNWKEAAQPDAPINVPCGQCIGCRLERSRQWAIRCVHEASQHEHNSFITLTFSPEALEKRENPWSLDVRDFQLFMKRLRFKYGSGIRFFHCGEYGEKHGRPHYHAIIFGLDFEDKELYSVTRRGDRLYTSKGLSECWPHGYAIIGDVTFESAAYVARYITKKITGDEADDHYWHVDEETGEAYPLKPEYTTMSRRPGIGKAWFDKYKSDVYPNDFVVLRGKKMRPPAFYDKLLESTDGFEYEFVKDMRKLQALLHSENNTRERLDVREKCKKIQTKALRRHIDEET